ncbi:MAG: phospholipase D family protein [Lactobacillaceae bacterium]|jgi:hypothetical protein|nr:phospholipase D family protein [Lactobacillaceae bacterium]
MSVTIVTSNQDAEFLDGVIQARKSIKIVSPFLSKSIIDEMMMQKDINTDMALITRFKSTDFLAGVNNLDALEQLITAGASVYAVKNLHAKLFIFDDFKAIVGSANLTKNGLENNAELSVMFQDEQGKISELVKYFETLRQEADKYEVTLEMIEKERQNLDGAVVGKITGLTNQTNFGAVAREEQVVTRTSGEETISEDSFAERWTEMLFSVERKTNEYNQEPTVTLDSNGREYKYKVNMPKGKKWPDNLDDFPEGYDFTKISIHYLPTDSDAPRFNTFSYNNAKAYYENGDWLGEYKGSTRQLFFQYMYDRYLKV